MKILFNIKFRRQYRRYWTLGRRRDWGTGTSFTPIAQKSVQTHSFLDWCFRPLYFYPICTKFSACIITYVIRINMYFKPNYFSTKILSICTFHPILYYCTKVCAKISQNLWKNLPNMTQIPKNMTFLLGLFGPVVLPHLHKNPCKNLTKFMEKSPKFDANPQKYVFFTGGIWPGWFAKIDP